MLRQFSSNNSRKIYLGSAGKCFREEALDCDSEQHSATASYELSNVSNDFDM